MVSFRVRADRLSEVAALIGTVVATFDSNLASVDRAVSRTVNTTWIGEDAEKFSENWATFETVAAQVRLALTQLQHGLIAADGTYSSTEGGIGRGFNQRSQGMVTVKNNAASLGRHVATGEERAEDMAEYFGRDYAGDDEVERFGGGMVGRRSTGQATGGGSGDTDGDGDDDSIGTGPYLAAENRDSGIVPAEGGAHTATEGVARAVKGDTDV